MMVVYASKLKPTYAKIRNKRCTCLAINNDTISLKMVTYTFSLQKEIDFITA
jgi:hypothetical protein